MKLLTGDLHITDNDRDRYRLEFLQRRLPKLARQFKATTIEILGDITTKKDFHGSWLVNTMVDTLTELADDFDVDVTCGNHDYQSDIENPFFRFMDYMDGISFINQPRRQGSTLWLPHTRNYEHDWADLDFDGVELILTHNTFAGSRSETSEILAGIPLDALPEVSIYTGDVHVPQRVRNITCVGAPFGINFGDVYEPRIILLDKDNQPKSIRLKGPAKRILQARSISELKRQLADTGKDDIIRIELKLAHSDYPKWGDLQAEARRLLNGRRLDSIIPVIEAGRSSHDPSIRRERDPVSDRQLLEEYGQAQNIDNETLAVGESLL